MMNAYETQATISQLFTNLNIGTQCIENPSSCKVTYYVANHDDKSEKCIIENCTSLSVEQINLVDLFSSFADINNAKYVSIDDFDALKRKNNDVFTQIAKEFIALKEYSLVQAGTITEIVEYISSFQPMDIKNLSNALKFNSDFSDYTQFSNNQFVEQRIKILDDESQVINNVINNHDNIFASEKIVYETMAPEEITTCNHISFDSLALVGIFSDDILFAIKQLFEEARIVPENLKIFNSSASLESIIIPNSSSDKNTIFEINKGNFLDTSDAFVVKNVNQSNILDEQVQSLNLDMGAFKNFLVEIGVSVISI